MPERQEALSRTAIADCATEPIHIPGGIQPHGYLLCVDNDGTILQASSNVASLAGQPVDAVLGQPLSALLGEFAGPALAALDGIDAGGIPVYAGTISKVGPAGDDDGVPMAVVVHRYADARIVELEPARGTADVFASMYPLVRTFFNQLEGAGTVEALAELAVREVHRIAGMGRTMLYRFDEDGHGHVLAEAAAPGYPTYLDHRFPASDIPAQARSLYVRNRIRLIADASYTPAPLVPPLHPRTGRPTDLTFASLRSVSPVHVQYMKNMDTWASMSMSIVVQGRLWGLISCHDARPCVPSFEVRAACEHIAQVLSMQIEAKEDHAQASYRLALRERQSRLLAAMANTEDFVDALSMDAPALLKLTQASGAAIVFEGRVVLVGATPPQSVVEDLIAWLDRLGEDDVYATDSLATVWQGARGHEADCAGLLVASISRLFRNYIVWFRPEVARTIRWAGDPRAKLSSLSSTMSPRESFETWSQTVRGRSLPWLPAEVEIAREFRAALLSIVLKRAETLAQLALELGRANRELEGFSYTVSHDLRAPLRHIVGFADLLGQMEGDRLSERGRHYLARILAQARFGGRLVDDLLSFAQLGRAALRPQAVDLHALATTLATEESSGAGERTIEWRIEPVCTVTADPVLLHLVMQNLIANAVKFTGQAEVARIEVACARGTGEFAGSDIVTVRDNGVGFDMRYVDKLFGVFHRLHRSEEFPGTGIGLATVRRIVERHGGLAWAEGELGKGASFHFSLPRHHAMVAGDAQESAGEAAVRIAQASQDVGYTPVRKDTK